MSEHDTAANETSIGADEVYAVSAELVRAVEAIIDDERWDDLHGLVDPLHAADLADLVEMLPRDDRRTLVAWLGGALEPEVLTELEEAVLEGVLAQLAPANLARAIGELATDDAVYLLENLPEERLEEVLHAVPAPERVAVEEALSYPEDSAGRLMQREFIAVPAYWTVGQVIDYCRESADLPDEFYEIFVVDPRHERKRRGGITLLMSGATW